MENPLADIERIERIEDPAERAVEIGRVLNALPNISKRLREMRQAAVRELQALGWSHAQISKALGIHRNRAQQIAEGRSGGGKRSGAASRQSPERHVQE